MKHPNRFECGKKAVHIYKERTFIYGTVVQVEGEKVWIKCGDGTRLSFHYIELCRNKVVEYIKLYFYKIIGRWL